MAENHTDFGTQSGKAKSKDARRETPAICQHVALDGDLEAKYQQTMKGVGL